MTFSKKQFEFGFTLVELLMVIAVLAILSSLALVVIAGAQSDARSGATATRISQIDAMLSERMAEYEVRRIPLRLGDYVNTSNQEEFAYQRQLNRRIIADIINAEMPRARRDVAELGNYPGPELLDWINRDPGGIIGEPQQLIDDLSMRPPALATRFRYLDLNRMTAGTDPVLTPVRTSSEFLYLILQATDVDGTPATDFLSKQSFADTDGDGFLEVVDAWGRPMSFGFIMYRESDESDESTYTTVPIDDVPFNDEFDGLDPGFDEDAAMTFENANPPYPEIWKAAYGIPAYNIRLKIVSFGETGIVNGVIPPDGEHITNFTDNPQNIYPQ